MIKDYINKDCIVSLLMGFSAGVPLLMTISILQAWMKESGIDLSTIGLFGLVGIPYSLKFLWAPFLDRFSLPFLGRRRGWLLVSQILIIVTILGISYIDITSQLTGLVMLCLGLTFLSATQDILIDAYRRENVSEKHLPLASSLYIIGYRVAMAVVGSVGFILSDSISFNLVYLCLRATLFLRK
jgi:PAT family beta-lactamase induction signal transducer AmpG